MSAVYYIHLALKCLLTLLLGAVGTLCLLAAANVMPLPEPLRLSDVDGKDKFTRGAALLHLPLPLFLALLGLCKTAAAVGFWAGSRAIDELVTLLAVAMYLCVAVGHYHVDGAWLAPLAPATLCLIKYLTTPEARVKSTKSRL
jgi:hypothetical protein